MENIKVAYFTW